ncbi:uncharacterized protein LOC129738293, partial [Uranotaenia lowii]|uniref:uncharacterized protein LOC129738293 n=1 Tax=Uranotaenia lowii TaxID=190385 RepID=UPI0024794315
MALQELLCLTIALISFLPQSKAVSSEVDFRSFDFGEEDPEFFGTYEKSFNNHDYFPSDFNLGSLDLIAAAPRLTKLGGYVNPEDVQVATRHKRKTSSSEEQDRGADDSEDAEEDEEAGSEEEKSEGDGSVDDYSDRYERFVKKHFSDHEKQRKKDDSKEDGASFEYRFDYSPSADYERIKQESEAQSRQLAKDPKNCKSYEENGMICHACRDPATDTTSESCSYATVPHHKKFAYVKQKNYNSKDQEKDDDDTEDAVEDPTHEADRNADDTETYDEKSEKEAIISTPKPQIRTRVVPTPKSVIHTRPGGPTTLRTTGGGYRHQPVIDIRSNRQRATPATTTTTAVPISAQRRSDQTSPAVQQDADGYYNFYTQFFPPTSTGESASKSQKLRQPPASTRQQQTSASNNDDVYALGNNEDVTKVLQEFQGRDWTNCTKGEKDKLTCYTCTDKAGVKHE